MKVDFIDILLFVLFFQIVSLIPFLLFHKKDNYPSKILAMFLIAKALCITNFISLKMFGTFYDFFPHLFFFGSSFTILWGPLLYFYTKSLAYNNFRIGKKELIHFIPFLIHFVYLTVVFHLNSADTKRELLSSGNLFFPGYFMTYSIYIQVTTLVYTLFSFGILFKFKKRVKENFSSIGKMNLEWMTFVLIGFLTKFLSDVVFLFDTNILGNSGTIPLLISRLILYAFITLMFYKGLKYNNIFDGLEEATINKKSSLSKIALENYLTKLIDFVETEKPYLNPDLTLAELSEQADIPQRSLSEVLNVGLKQNFYEFINQYRVEESALMLADDTNDNKNILEILYHVGFNSKSSFNKSFKKFTGLTPAAYRQSQKARKESYQYN